MPVSDWFVRNAARLRQASPDRAVAEIAAELGKLDARLGAEIADGDGVRELVVTAYGERSLFGLATAQCTKMVAPGWKVQALKPPRGFDFVLEVGGVEVRASALRFTPLESEDAPAALAIRVLVPDAEVETVEQVVHLLVETGVGELAAAKIDHLEVGPTTNPAEEGMSIGDLGEFIEWRSRQVRGA